MLLKAACRYAYRFNVAGNREAHSSLGFLIKNYLSLKNLKEIALLFFKL